jgi:hypothetical protein
MTFNKKLYENLMSHWSIDHIFEPTNKHRSLHVIWSGGCDSTLVLHQLLTSLKIEHDDRTVNTYNFTHTQLGEKVSYERTARMKYLAHVSEMGFNNINNKEINLNDHTIHIGDYG